MIILLVIVLAGLAILPSMKWFSSYYSEIFWVSFVLYFNPAGLFSGFSDGNIISKVKYFDLLFVFMMISWYLSGYWRRQILINAAIFRFFSVSIGMFVFYIVLVYGFMVPSYYGYSNMGMFIQKHRQYIYSLPVFISVYQFAVYNLNGLTKPMLYISLGTMGAYFISVITGLELIPVMTWSRFGENDRIAPVSYGLAKWFIAMGLFSVFTGLPTKNKVVIYTLLNMLLMILAMTLTLTRREYVEMFFVIIFSATLSHYISPGYVMRGMKNVALIMTIFIAFLFVFFPKHIGFSMQLTEELGSMVVAEGNTEESDYRVTGGGDLLIVKEIINQNPIFGIGYYPAQWDQVVEMKKSGILLGLALDASSEVPIFGAVMRLGVIGLVLPVVIHLAVLILSINCIFYARKNIRFLKENYIELLLYLNIVYNFISLFTLDFYALFLEYYSPVPFSFFSASIALIIAIRTRLQVRMSPLPITNAMESIPQPLKHVKLN